MAFAQAVGRCVWRRVTGACCFRLRSGAAVFVLALLLQAAPARRARGEDRIDLKTLFYQEDDDRMQILAPAVLVEKDLTPTLTIKVEGIYNAISGASPTGAPAVPGVVPAAASQRSYSSSRDETPAPPPVSPAPAPDRPPRDDDDDDDDDHDDDRGRDAGIRGGAFAGGRVLARAGATPPPPPPPDPPPADTGTQPSPSPTPAPSSRRSSDPTPSAPAQAAPAPSGQGAVPKADVEDTRVGVNVELAKRLERQTVSAQLSFSTEDDYQSQGVAVRDAIDFNQKNSTLLLGAGYTHDIIDAPTMESSDTKDSLDVMAGITQVLDRRTLLTLNLTLGRVDGYMSDPYKVVELNGVLVPEKRPDHKDKQVVFLSLTRFVEPAKGSAEASIRHYQDSFGITAMTYGLAWYQKLGRHFVVRPAVRYYAQSEADFYAIRFTGSPEEYSSDYRVSEFEDTGYGLKLIWTPTARFSTDLAVERFVQEGRDGLTPDDAYPSATYFIAGVRLWL